MKRKRIFFLVLLIVAIICYFNIKPPQEESIVWQGSFSFVARQKDNHVEYFLKSDPYSVYNYLSSMTLERAPYAVLGRWLYKVILTDTLTPDGSGKYLLRNDGSDCVILVYKNYLEINGITYLFPEQADIVGWFSYFYNNNVGDHKVYISYE